MALEDAPRYRQIYDELRGAIESGRIRPGDKLPSEAALGREYATSRITVGRAVRDLQQAGLVERRAGSGTFARRHATREGLSFGLLMPNVDDTAILDSICRGMTASSLAEGHALVWGSTAGAGASLEARALGLCGQYVARRVDGVFFAPLEGTAAMTDVNRRVAATLDDARIPVVLLDRTVEPYPRGGHHDLVGIDNRRAGYLVTAHLLARGRRRLAFVAPPHGASTVDARRAGFHEALFAAGLAVDPTGDRPLDPGDARAFAARMTKGRPDGLVAVNDRTAAAAMRALGALGYAVPRDVALVGIDDVELAAHLPVPLTTLRQPTRALGEVAMATMLDRVAHRDGPARDVLLRAELVIRASCGEPRDGRERPGPTGRASSAPTGRRGA